MRILSACLSQLVVTVVQVASATMSRTDSTHTRGSRPNNLRLKRIFVSCPNSSHLTSRHVVHRTFDHIGHVHSFLIYNTIFLTYLTYTFSASFNPVQVHDIVWVALWLSFHPSRVMGPNSFAEYKDHQLFTEDKQFSEHQDLAEHEDFRVKPLFFHPPSMASTYDSAESIVTPPPDSDLDDEQIQCSAGITTVRSEKQMRNDHKFITLHQKTWCPVHLKIR